MSEVPPNPPPADGTAMNGGGMNLWQKLLIALGVVVALVGGAVLIGLQGRGSGPIEATPSPTSEAASSATASATSEATVDSATPEAVPTPTGPQRIVSLSPSATEILFAIGVGDQVVAVDNFSYYPPEAPVVDLSGFDPNVEAVLAYEPDLVVIANDTNEIVASLELVEVPVFIDSAPSNLPEAFAAIIDLGIAVDRVEEAAALANDIDAQMSAAVEAIPNRSLRVYHELDSTYFSASSFSFIGAVYEAIGLTNIADEADTDGYGFPQLTEEYIIEADPELIVITDQVGYTVEDVMNRPGWGEVSAVRNGAVVSVDADIASRWGPRLPLFVDAIAEALESL